MQPEASIIIPCYNERDAIAETVAAVVANLPAELDFEIVLVDDGSHDGSREVIARLADGDPRVHAVFHDSNRGYGAALKSGIRRARAERLVITDADGTYPVDAIAGLLERLADHDMVVGARTGEDVTYPLHRKLPKDILRHYAAWLVRRPIPDINSGLRAFHKSVVERYIKILPSGFSFTTTITMALLSNDYRVLYVPVNYYGRVGKSKVRPIRDALNYIQLIVRTGVYFAPLRVLTPVILLSLACFVASLGYDALVLDNITDKTLILLFLTLNTTMFALLADMIDKRQG